MNKLCAALLAALCLCLCCTLEADAQNDSGARSLRFLVVDSTSRKPLGGVSCRVFTAAGKFYKYGVSRQDGHMTLTAGNTDRLEFSFIGYGKRVFNASTFSVGKENTVELSAKDVVLREVKVNAPPIHARGDTLVYNVSKFKTAGDRHLEDVLKKLPGVKVADNGTVSVQGKAINKFYIEGLDLLGNSYNQATKNMPVDAVRSVEVLENHQPVKVLQGKQFTEQAALNIKLDEKHKLRPFGEVQAGGGIKPGVWDNRLFLTQAMKSGQLLLSGKMNNIGTNLSAETSEHIDFFNYDAYEPQPQTVLSIGIGGQALPTNRYVRNKSYSAGLNYLAKLSESSTLRLNVLFYGDRSSQSSLTDNYYGGISPVNITENKTYKLSTLSLMPILKYEMNSARTFVSDELRYSFNRTTSRGVIDNGRNKIDEKVKSRPSYVQNYFSSSFLMGGKVFQAKSLFRYFDRNELLDDHSDGVILYNTADRYATRSTMTRNKLATKTELFGQNLSLDMKVYYRNNRYGYLSNVGHETLETTFSPNYYIKYGDDRSVVFSLPVSWTHVSLKPEDKTANSRSFFAFSPSVSVYHSFTQRLKLTLNASMRTYDASDGFNAIDTLRTGYRSMLATPGEVFKNTSKRASLRLGYRDILSMFFASLVASYSDERRESYTDYTYDNSFSKAVQKAGTNHSKTLTTTLNADKTFAEAGLSLKAETAYSLSSYFLSQNSELTENHSNVFSAGLEATFQKLKWLRLSLNTAGYLYWERSRIYKSDVLSSLKTGFSVFVFPVKQLEMKLKMENFINEIADSRYKSCTFLDGELHYKINKTWEAGLTAANLLNMRTYTIMTNSGLNTFSSSLPLTGRRVLLTVQMSF